MNLFYKNKTKETAPQQEYTPTAEQTLQEPTKLPQEKLTTEERVRQWWQTHFGENIPDEMLRWMKQVARAEAHRQTIASALLTPQQQTRIEDARQLAETKLRNIEASLQQLNNQRDWTNRFNEKNHELTEHRNRLYEVNKRLAMLANEERELNRFETFETIQYPFLRMSLLEEMARTNKQAQSLLVPLLEEAQQTVSERQKMLSQLNNKCSEATKQMTQVRDTMADASRILGERTILDLDARDTKELTDSIKQQKMGLEQETGEIEEEIKKLSEKISQQHAKRQAMEPHQNLLENCGMVVTLLKRLSEIKMEQEQLSRVQNDENRRQQEENDMLGRVFAEYQSVEGEIKSLNEELNIHRRQNLGRSSYSLQERAMQLKSRRQMLLAAQSLWNRIQSGYQLIEEKTQTVNRLRLNLDNLKLNISNLENKIVPMRQLCHDKEYTLTLSKSQNVIQLRGDLQEGVSCTVCGATHHPYHSDTMLEQSKLISELRTDFELLQAELISQEEQLYQLQIQQAAETARRDVEEETLSRLRQRQMEDVREWSVFASLDRTFAECSPSTNMDARTAMLRQLLQNTAHDADDAQNELNEYNYHQTRINEISEKLTQKELQRNDLTARLNEVNTGCQVLARNTERTRKMRAERQEQYSRLYERLGSLITIHEWYAEWQRNNESLQMRIEQMTEQWKQLNEEIPQYTHRLEMQKVLLAEKQSAAAYLDALAILLHNIDEQRSRVRKEGEKNYESMLGNMEVKTYYDKYFQALLQANQDCSAQRDEILKAAQSLSTLQGRQQELEAHGGSLDENVIAAKSQLDIWIRKFNANHPPVQYAELEQALSKEKDWNISREQIRSTRIEAMLEQARVDNLRSAIIALQAESCRTPNTEGQDVLESLIAQQKQLEKQRQDVLMQLAEQQIALTNHKKCQEQLKAEEEELYAMTNSH